MLFRSGSEYLLCGGWNGGVILYDVLIRKVVLIRDDVHTGIVSRLVESPDKSMVVSASEDRTIAVMNASDLSLRVRFSGHADEVTGVCCVLICLAPCYEHP